jgi:aldose 1-epimerase
MTSIFLSASGFDASISTHGGLVTRLHWSHDGKTIPLLRDAPDGAGALQSSCYPLVPFGNRVRNNSFTLDGRSYTLEANTDWDPHYLHGDGWLGEWTVIEHDAGAAELLFSYPGGQGTPYAYEASQRFRIEGGAFHMSLSVTNRGSVPLPFGIGWHPYFPMTPKTTLKATAQRLWSEVEGWLPGEAIPIPEDLDFSAPRGLPHRWVNNGIEGWSGEAEITWPERATKLALSAEEIFHHAFIFVSDTKFDPGYQREYFCFEPMSHLANGHNLPGLGDLAVLAPGQTLSGAVQLRPEAIG